MTTLTEPQRLAMGVLNAANWRHAGAGHDGGVVFRKPGCFSHQSHTIARDGTIGGLPLRSFAQREGLHRLPVLMTRPELMELIQ